jgi:hypothetical protein
MYGDQPYDPQAMRDNGVSMPAIADALQRYRQMNGMVPQGDNMLPPAMAPQPQQPGLPQIAAEMPGAMAQGAQQVGDGFGQAAGQIGGAVARGWQPTIMDIQAAMERMKQGAQGGVAGMQQVFAPSVAAGRQP